MLLKAFLSPPAASSALDGAKNRTPRKPRRLYLFLEANLNRDVLFDFMKGHEMYFLVIAIMTN